MRASNKTILIALEKLVQLGNTEPHLLFFHYSGHGCYIKDFNNDEVDHRDECLVPLGPIRSYQDLIRDDELHAIIKKLKPMSKLFILCDSCHSGTAFDLPFIYRKQNDFKTIDSSCENPNIIKLSGCRDDQTSASIKVKKIWKGALTSSFLEVVKNMNHKDSWETLFDKVTIALKKKHMSQRPTLGSNTNGSLGSLFILPS